MATRTATDARQQEIIRQHAEAKAYHENHIAFARRVLAQNTDKLRDLNAQIAKLSPKVDTLKRWADGGHERAKAELRTKSEELANLFSQRDNMQINGVTNVNARIADHVRLLEDLERVGLSFESLEELDAVFAEIDGERRTAAEAAAANVRQAGEMARARSQDRSWWPFGAKA